MKSVLIILLLVSLAALLVAVALDMPPLGEPSTPANASPLTHYVIANAVRDTGSPNRVAAVVADYRAYDTLGETTVLFTAVAAILALERGRKDEKSNG